MLRRQAVLERTTSAAGARTLMQFARRITQSPVAAPQSPTPARRYRLPSPASSAPTRLQRVIPQTRIPEPNCRFGPKVTARRNLRLCVRARSNRRQRLVSLSQPLIPLSFRLTTHLQLAPARRKKRRYAAVFSGRKCDCRERFHASFSAPVAASSHISESP